MTPPTQKREGRIWWFTLGAAVLVLALLGLPRPEPPPPVAAAGATRPPRAAPAAPFGGRLSATATEPGDDRLTAVLLGEPEVPVTPEARRLLSQAVLGLEHLYGCVRHLYPDAAPNDSEVAVLHAYGGVLFANDFAYATRVCPELDPERAGVAYGNALQVLTQPELLALARETIQADDRQGAQVRPAVPMEDHYEQTAPAYPELLDIVGGFVNHDPLSTDLFNDVLIYVTSKTEAEVTQREILRAFLSLARAEAAGVTPPLPGPEGSESDADLNPPNVDDRVRNQLVPLLTAYREIFTYRFTQLHGISDERFIETLARMQAPPTQWIHIQPPAR